MDLRYEYAHQPVSNTVRRSKEAVNKSSDGYVAKFNSCKQEEGEPVDSFITDLHALAEHCEYKDLHDEMIRDRIVVGLRDASLSEKLQLDSKLTLETAVTKA